MSCEADGAEVYLYVISSSRLERAKIGVAGDAEKRLRELQVGSPVELKLALTRAYAERRDAVAVAEELYRHFAGRRLRGSWYRLAVADMVAIEELAPEVKERLDLWAGCIAGTISLEAYTNELRAAGFKDVDIEVTRDVRLDGVEGRIASVYIRARKPAEVTAAV